jgi:hypothetical protein
LLDAYASAPPGASDRVHAGPVRSANEPRLKMEWVADFSGFCRKRQHHGKSQRQAQSIAWLKNTNAIKFQESTTSVVLVRRVHGK